MGAQKGKTKLEPEKRAAELSYLQIFRYGTWVENLGTVVGAFLALLSGGAICYNMVQFGEMSTALVERTTPQYHSQMSSYLPLASLFGGGRRLINASYEENMAALVEDVTASIVGVFVSTGICLVICVVSVALINWSALRQTTRIRNLFLKAVLRQDMAWFDTDTTFNLASSMSENMMKIKAGMGDKLSVVCNLLGTGIICLAQSFPLGWELTLSCATVIPFAIVVSIILSNYQSKSSTKEMESYGQAGKQAEEVLKSVRTVLAFSGEQKEVERYRRLLEPAERYVRRRGLFTGLGNGFNWVLTYCLNTIGMAYGARLVLADLLKPSADRRYQVGGIFSIQASMYMATQSITFCVPHIEAFSAARGAAAEVFHLIENEPTIDSLSEQGVSPRRVKGDIIFENVHFSYPARSNVKVLNGFSIHIKPGEAVALVGSSGCGKTTILQLLQRLYDPHSGSVKLDGRNVKDVNISWLRTALGVVGQEPVLFRGTIYENIAVGCPEATMEEVQRVATMAYAHDFITRLADGYETVIGERGASLSGGQKQRVAIARALLREPAVLLLDEATSALDPHSERQVQAALDRASEGRTTLIVSHRLSTIVNADRIICMDKGVIVEEGTHQELMKAKGMYYNLVLTNNGGREPDLIETFPEEPEGEPEEGIVTSAPRMGVRKSMKTRSNKKDCQEWMTPRGSVSSAISVALQNRIFNGLEEPEENIIDEEEVKPVSDWQLLKLNSPEWILVTVGSVAAVALGLCFPALALVWSNSAGIFALPNQEDIIHMADLLAGMFVVIAAVAGTAVFLQSYCFTSSGVLLTSRLRGQYFQSLLKQEMGYFDMESNTVGALCSRLSSDASEVQGATGMMIGLMLQGVTSVLVGLIIALCYEWKLALVGAAFLPIMVGATWLEGIFYQKSQAQERDAIESATSIATEAVIGVRTVQSLGIERQFMAKFEEALDESCSAISRQSRWRGLVMGVGLYTPFVSSLCTLAYGAKLVAYEGLNYQYALLVMEATMYGAYMLGQSLVYAPSFNTARTCGAKVLHLINRKPKIVTEPGVIDKDLKATGSLLFKDIEFGYPTRPQQKVLRGFNLKIEPGKTVALVGSSGCGKSTILQVLQRFYDPDTGNVEVDGHDTKGALTIPRLRRQLGVVQQEPVLFSRSLAENIAYGDTQRQVTMQEVIAAAKAANIHNFIASLPKGYDTFLGANGAQLSGGQKQRVCIARALIRSPRILLLDEATSALDANSEKTVAEALEKAAHGRTCITVAHRLSTIINSDLICVLDKGKVVEQGSHSELVEKRGLYWRLCKGQNLA